MKIKSTNTPRDDEKASDSLKTRIFNFIAEGRYVSFAEIVRRFEEAKGELSLVSTTYKNIIYWQGLSEEAVNAFVELVREKRIFMHYTSQPRLLYMVDGALVSLPLVKRARNYSKPHWLGVTLCTFPQK